MDEGCYHHHPSVAGPIRDLPGRRPAALQLMARPARWWSKAGEGRAPEQVRRFDSVRPAGSGNLNRSLRRGRQRIGNVFMVRASVWMLLVRWRTAQCHLASCQPHIDPIGIHRWSVIHTVRRCRPIDMPSTTAAACHFIPPVLLSFTSSFVCVLSPRCDASSLTCCFKFSLLCLFSPVNSGNKVERIRQQSTLLPICFRFRQQSIFNKVYRVEFNFVASACVPGFTMFVTMATLY